ncbi:hypothetical protein PSBY109024_19800 [Pseudoalteromonas byunsanensis]
MTTQQVRTIETHRYKAEKKQINQIAQIIRSYLAGMIQLSRR